MIQLTEQTWIKQNEKFALINEDTRNITLEVYGNITSKESQKFFRRLGGSETLRYSYDKNGNKVAKLTSLSPDRNTKIVRIFNFNA